jgi:dipeptidyl aminopeptidase/acylaminoacyl peptidase
MRRSLRTVVAVLLVVPGAMAVAEPRPLTVDDIFRLKVVGDPQFAPDGRWVAYTLRTPDLHRDGAATDIFMVSSSGGETIRLTSGDKASLTPRWSPDGRFLAFVSSRDGKHDQVWLLNRLGGEAFRLTDFPADVRTLSWSPDSKRLAVVVGDKDPDEVESESGKSDDSKTAKPIVIRRLQFMRDGDGYLRELYNHIYLVDIASRAATQLTSGSYDDDEPAWSPDGAQIAFSSNRTPNPDSNENTDIYVISTQANAMPRAVVTSPGTDGAPTWSPDGKLIAYVSGGDPKDFWYGATAIGVVPAAGGPARRLTSALDRNVTSPRFAPDGSGILFVIEEGGNEHLGRVPIGGGAVTRVVDGERTVQAFDIDAAGHIVVLAADVHHPMEVSAVEGSELRRLTHANDAVLAELKLAPVERLRAKSADGTMIDGFLVRPPDAVPGVRLPTILRIHGGPTSQYETEFQPEWQILAAHGYAVVAMNPRGSTGFGTPFARAIFADWGHRDFEDVMAGVDRAIEMGIADPNRLGVGGWSYGGILTDYVITKTQRFKAATSGASETNFLANYGTDHYQYAWETELGLPWRNVERWIRLSPWYQVEKITTPTLLLCGTDDMNVPALNSEQLYEALKRLGRETELVLYPGQTHQISKPSYIRDRFVRYLDWYDRHLVAPTGSSPASATSRSSDTPQH